jgi:hypothetical protein
MAVEGDRGEVPDASRPKQILRRAPSHFCRTTGGVETHRLVAECGARRYRPPAMSDDDLKAELERLKAENERLKKGGQQRVSLKVSEKGGVSVYGLGRFPVTLYKEQWAKLLDMADEIRKFMKENDSKLKTKGE